MNSGLLQKNEETAFRLRGLYRSYGYQPYKMSKFEEYDLYVRNKSFLLSENILTFTDLDGKLMALKPDVTLSILKNGRGGPGLQKVYYNENVYRPSATAGGFREIPQTGLECIGSLDAAAEGEVLMLAAKSLAVISPEYLLDVSHQGFVAGLLEGLDLPDETRRRALAAMGAKNTPALERLAAEGLLPEKAAQTLSRLALLYDRPAPALAALEPLAENQRMATALRELKELCALMEQRGLAEHLRLDFSIANDMNYYSGVIFRGFVPGLAAGVLAGGRYDHLLHRMGRQGGAIGFAVYLDQLERFGAPAQDEVDVLVLYDDSVSAARVAAETDALVAAGQTVRAERQKPEAGYKRLLDLRKEGGDE